MIVFPSRRLFAVIPTRVGVNRKYREFEGRMIRNPHACGGEPYNSDVNWIYFYVIPTRVGVNRRPKLTVAGHVTVIPTRVGVNRIRALEGDNRET